MTDKMKPLRHARHRSRLKTPQLSHETPRNFVALRYASMSWGYDTCKKRRATLPFGRAGVAHLPYAGAPVNPKNDRSLPRRPQNRAAEAWSRNRRSESRYPRLSEAHIGCNRRVKVRTKKGESQVIHGGEVTTKKI